MPLKDSKKINVYGAALMVILVINALLKWRFFAGLTQADDFSYGVYAYTMFRDIWPWNTDMDFRMLRLGLMFPVSIVFRILPPGEFAAVLFPMMASLGTVVLAYLIGKRLYGPNAGIIGAFVLATFPGDVLYGTMLLPDIVVPFYLGAAVLAFLYTDTVKGYKSYLLYALTGFFIFLAFITRENSYYFLLFFLPFAFSAGRWKRGLYLVGAGFVLPVLALYGIYYLKTGDFLFNVHLATTARDSQIASGYIPKNSDNMLTQFYYMFPAAMGKVLEGGRRMYSSSTFGLTFYFGLPCVLYTLVKAIIKRDRKGLLIPWWFLLVYLFLEFGTLSFSHYQVMKKLPRFLLTLTPAMALCYGVVISDAAGLGYAQIKRLKDLRIRWITGIAAVALMAVVLATSMKVAGRYKTGLDSNMEEYRWGYSVFKPLPRKPIYGTGGWWNNKLSFYFMPDIRYADVNGHRSDMLRDIKTVDRATEISGSYVLIDRKNFSGQNDLGLKYLYDDYPPYVVLIPKDWKLLGAEYGVEIYEVPENWDYDKPFGKYFALWTINQAVTMNDPVRVLYCMHPAFIQRLDRETFFNFFNELKRLNEKDREVYLINNVQFATDNGKWKIYFDTK
ncbi:glycosyltransferase family 39 protein [bacterium]|nr:glycosyltransferase family 39 protein [bacterium]